MNEQFDIPSFEERAKYVALAHQMRAEAIRDGFTLFWDTVAQQFKRFGAMFRRENAATQ